MLSLILQTAKTVLPDWPEWALDILLVMTLLLGIVGIIAYFFTPEEEDEEGNNKNGEKGSSVGLAELEKWTVQQLQQEAKRQKLPVSATATRSELMTALTASSTTGELQHHHRHEEFHAFRNKYLIVHAVIMLADWMQGTHMYTLYLSYGVNISALFLTGFLSGAIFAPFLGSFVDKFGRKRSCIVYCLLEICINIMEHVNNTTILLAGRVLGGISTNLLFSAFESWMTTEHRKNKFPEEWMSRTYSQMSIVNGTTAILAGIVSQVLEDFFGHIGPFQGAVALTVLALLLVLRWDENYGEEHAGDHTSSTVGHQFWEGWSTTLNNSHIWRIGLTQALSEGAMYTFVFMWVPTLLSLNPPGGVPTGCVFSALMMAITIGGMSFPFFQSFLSKTLVSKSNSSELCASLVYMLASLSMAVPVLCLSSLHIPTLPYCQELILASFLLVEFCVGLFMPVAGTLRSKYVPDALQGAILNIFRLPLNFIVVSGTYATDHFEAYLVFILVSACFFFAALLQATMISPAGTTTTAKSKHE